MNIEELKRLSVTRLMKNVESLSSSDTVSRAIGSLRESGENEILLDYGDKIGVVRLLDILNSSNITRTRLSSIMQYVPRLNSNNIVGEAATIMFEHRIRSLPILENNELKGQITSKSIINKMMGVEKLNFKVSRIMTPNPTCIHASDSASKAKQLLVRKRIDQLPILDGTKVLAVVTTRSMILKMLPPVDRLKMYADWRAGRLDQPALKFASDSVVENDAHESIENVFQHMVNRRTTYSIIANFDEVQGIATFRDYLRLLVSSEYKASVPMYMVGLPEDPFEAGAARSKFVRVLNRLQRSLPEILEARAIIKSAKTRAPRQRYQVKVLILARNHRYSYSGSGFELPDIFDRIVPWSKSIMQKGGITRYEHRRGSIHTR